MIVGQTVAMTTWPTHRARARHARQLQRWERRQRRLARRTARKHRVAMEPAK